MSGLQGSDGNRYNSVSGSQDTDDSWAVLLVVHKVLMTIGQCCVWFTRVWWQFGGAASGSQGPDDSDDNHNSVSGSRGSDDNSHNTVSGLQGAGGKKTVL